MRISVLALACSAAAFSAAGWADDVPAGVALKVAVQPSVTITDADQNDPHRVLTLPVTLDLTNTGTAAAQWTMNNACETQIWVVTDSTGNAPESQAVCPKLLMPVGKTLAPGQTDHVATTIALHVPNFVEYPDDITFTLHYTYWGVTGTAPFVVRFPD